MNLDTRGPDTPPAFGEDPEGSNGEVAPDEGYDAYPEPLDGSLIDDLGYGPYEEGDEGYDDGTTRPAGAGAAAVAGAVAAGAAAGTAAVARGFGTALGAAGSLASKATGRMGGMARGAADRAAERSATRAERRQTERWEDPLEQVRLSDTLEPTDEQLEPALPLLPGAAQEPLDKDQSRLALVVIAAFVLIAAIVGIWGLPKLWLGSGTGTATAPLVTQTVTASPSASGNGPSPSASPTPTPAPAAVIPIVSASQVSEDAGVQAARTAGAAFDGKGETGWQSSKYFATAQYGGLKGRTTGLLLDLGKSTDVHQVTFSIKGPADVTVYVGDQTKVAGLTPIGAVAQKDGESTVAVPNGGAVKGRYVVLWFTTLGPTDQAKQFRAQVLEASVR